MNFSIEVENIRCGGCANTISKKLSAIEGVDAVDVAIEDQVVSIDSENENVRDDVVAALYKIGYPERGTVEGVDALKEKAKSVVSCAIGKVS